MKLKMSVEIIIDTSDTEWLRVIENDFDGDGTKMRQNVAKYIITSMIAPELGINAQLLDFSWEN